MSNSNAATFRAAPLVVPLALAVPLAMVCAAGARADDEKPNIAAQEASGTSSCQGAPCPPQVKTTRPGSVQNGNMQPSGPRTDTTGGTEGTFADFER
ncbi:hypothetical protein [Afifella pfennigii]|uniref:hypothetical protein n=1 Tax=Afifella pfennigii TaxID=209897 RepID=UPI00047BBB89|nr:hypothetical protein [Afifella pfennigii]